MRQAYKEFRPVRKMRPRLVLGRRRQVRTRMRSREQWVLCASMSLFRVHRCVKAEDLQRRCCCGNIN
jgi:hypothetical protein